MVTKYEKQKYINERHLNIPNSNQNFLLCGSFNFSISICCVHVIVPFRINVLIKFISTGVLNFRYSCIFDVFFSQGV